MTDDEKPVALTAEEAAVYAGYSGRLSFLMAVRRQNMPPPDNPGSRHPCWRIDDLDRRLESTA